MPRSLLLLLLLLVNFKVNYFEVLSHGNSYLDNIEANNTFYWLIWGKISENGFWK